MKLYLIRHAESANNVLLTQSGSENGRLPDPEITARGHKQAELLAKQLAKPNKEPRQSPFLNSKLQSFNLTHLYCSLMTRSILTAEYIAEACQLPLVALPDIFERMGLYDQNENGEWVGVPGPNAQQFSDQFPNLTLPKSVGNEGWYNRPIETDSQFVERVKSSLATVKARHLESDDVVGMVVHGDYVDQSINEIMEVSRHPANYKGAWIENWATHNTSISRIDFIKGSYSIVYLNRVDHLPNELISW